MIPLHDDNPTLIKPLVTILFVTACIAIFLWQFSQGEGFQTVVVQYGAIPASLFGFKSLPEQLAVIPSWATLFTSMFMHGGWMHLIGNMLYLWIFGNNVEDAMGHGRFIVFYLICGVVAALAHAIPNAHSTIPMIGASGAISGVLGAYLLLYPRARVLVLIPLGFYITTLRLPAALVLLFWFALQLISTGDGIAWGAHIGGFIAGFVLIPLFKSRDVGLLGKGHRRHY